MIFGIFGLLFLLLLLLRISEERGVAVPQKNALQYNDDIVFLTPPFSMVLVGGAAVAQKMDCEENVIRMSFFTGEDFLSFT
jgi:hypothetical protein